MPAGISVRAWVGEEKIQTPHPGRSEIELDGRFPALAGITEHLAPVSRWGTPAAHSSLAEPFASGNGEGIATLAVDASHAQSPVHASEGSTVGQDVPA